MAVSGFSFQRVNTERIIDGKSGNGMESGGIRPGVSPGLDRVGSETRTAEPEQSKTVNLPTGKTVSVVEPQTTLSAELAELETDSRPEDTSLLDRKTENTHEKGRGKLRSALSWVGDKAKAGALKAAGYVQEKWGNAETEGSKKTEDTNPSEDASSAKDPQEASKSKGKKLLSRGITALKTAKSKVGSLPGRAAAPAKKLFSRSVSNVPPQPSASVLQAETAVKKLDSSVKTDVASLREQLQEARSDKTELKVWSALINDPTPFYDSKKEYVLEFDGGVTVEIKGEGLERAQSVRQAVDLAFDYKEQIDQDLAQVRDDVKELRGLKKEAKTARKEQLGRIQKETAVKLKSDFEGDNKQLKTVRTAVKKELQAVEKNLKKARKGDKQTIADTKASLKNSVENDTAKLKQTRQLQKKAQTVFKRELNNLKSELKAMRAEVAHQEKLMSGKKGALKLTAQAALDAAGKAERLLVQEITELRVKQAKLEAGSGTLVTTLKGRISENKQQLKELKKTGDVDQAVVASLERQVAELKTDLKTNEVQQNTLKEQYQADRRALSKLIKESR